MSTFLTGKALESEIDDIIWEAKETLLIVSPFIKLDEHFKKLFSNPKRFDFLKILVIFGKNENKVSKSLSKQDFEFFKQFSNISIIHAPKLHAKYYANEKKGVITSINLYDYSFTNENIEFGVLTEHSKSDIFNFRGSNNIENDAFNSCMEIANENSPVFIKRPVFTSNKFLVTLNKTYVKSEVLLDETQRFYSFSLNKKTTTKKLSDFPEEIDLNSTDYKRPVRGHKTEIKKDIKPEIQREVKTESHKFKFNYNKAKDSSTEINSFRTEEDLVRNLCDRLNKSFINKKFKPFERRRDDWFAKCDNFYNGVDICFEKKRITFKFNLKKDELLSLYNNWPYDMYEFDGFKYYWNDPYRELLVYRDDNFDWSDNNTDRNKDKKYYEVISGIIEKYRKLSN
ncbi:phospholipase D family protein [Algibacter sp. TI.3.09]|uniref:phospholipase D family protein n=1 Tax=Algibacter sp. TI.3.09 TaxID=3121298 RepID=UPI00311F99AC